MPEADAKPLDFIRQIIADDLRTGKHTQIVTRWPPEPNAYIHIGHAKAICINFGIAAEFGGRCHLRFDDTNPVKEEQEYVDAIKDDIRWLGFDWAEHEYYASDYFDQLYEWAVKLINDGKAYVDDQSADQIRETRGTLTTPGSESPCRGRSPQENLDLFDRMRGGQFPDGSKVLRAKIDMTSPNLNMRDPVMYRILHTSHHRTGDKWCIYPMYDWTHGQSDSIEHITHSLCSAEFENHRPLYDWFIQQLGIYPSRQIEFARGNITYTVTSKRKLLRLMKGGHVKNWDDPRLPTICGLRRRGYTPQAIRTFWTTVGVAKRENNIEVALLEHCLRDDLNKRAPRVMAVLNPLKVVITNYPDGQVDQLDAVNNPEDASQGTRKVPFTRELYIERDDFMEDPPRKFFRLAPGREVRLRYAYFITCQDLIKDADGNITELHCTYDPETRGGDSPDGRKVKATMHWVSAPHAVRAEVRLYGHLFTKEDPEDAPDDQDFTANLNPESLTVLPNCYIEPSVTATPNSGGASGGASGGGLPDPAAIWPDGIARYQFERLGYFCVDADSASAATSGGGGVFNRIVTLRDSWAKAQQKDL